MSIRKMCAVAVVGGMAFAAAGQEYHRQDPASTGGGYSSQDARNAGGLGWFSEVADNFPGQAGWSINQVEFWGTYTMPSGSPGNTQGFTIRFYTDAGGMPGARVYEQDVMTFTETEEFQANGWAHYHYTVDLATPFDITTPGQYWVSVVGILDRGGSANEPQWFWTGAATMTAPSAVQWFFSPGNFAPLNTDISIVLSNAGEDCAADFDGDGQLTLNDFVQFRNAYVAGNLAADFDGNGSLSLNDFVTFRNAYVAGCP